MVAIAGCSGCAILEENRLRKERSRVHSLIELGQNLEEAEQVLLANGYKLVYGEPSDDTGSKRSVTQLVVIGDTHPSVVESFFYAAEMSHPLKKESPYVVIRADFEKRTITRIE